MDFIPEQGSQQPVQQADMQMPQQQPQQMPAGGAMAQPGVHGAGLGAIEENPMTAGEEQATPEEQEDYKDLFGRVMRAVHDIRPKPNGGKSLADSTIEMLSNPQQPPEVAIGTTAGMIMTQISDMAQRAGKKYSGPVVQEVGLDLVAELMDIARFSGAIKNMPEEDSEPFNKLVELSALEAAKFYGEWQLQTGQADRQGHMKELEHQFRREAEAGELDDWGMEEFDPMAREAMYQDMTRMG